LKTRFTAKGKLKKSVAVLLLAGVMSFSSCGGGSDILSAIVSRLIIGSITGDFLGIASSILATSAAGTTFTQAVTSSAFSMAVNAGTSYTISVLDAGNKTVATLKYPKAPAPSTVFATAMNVTAPTTSALNKKDIDLGAIDISTRDANNFIVPANNPLEQNDLDEDGLNDFDDDDDNGNGIPDDKDKDDNSDGIPDKDEEVS